MNICTVNFKHNILFSEDFPGSPRNYLVAIDHLP